MAFFFFAFIRQRCKNGRKSYYCDATDPFNELCTGRRETTTFVARLPVMIDGKKFSRKLRFSNFSADQSSLPFDKTCCTRSFIYIYMRTHKYTCNIYKLAFAIHNTFCVRNRTHLTFYCHCSRRKIFKKKRKKTLSTYQISTREPIKMYTFETSATEYYCGVASSRVCWCDSNNGLSSAILLFENTNL